MKLEKLETKYLARNILCYENLESTQVLAKELAQKNQVKKSDFDYFKKN